MTTGGTGAGSSSDGTTAVGEVTTGTTSAGADTELGDSSSTGSPVGCGDGVLEPTEACDDGNLDNGDGCDDTCKLACQSACDCYDADLEFEKPCAALCPTCDNFWMCEAGVCEAACGPRSPDACWSGQGA